MSEGHFSGSVRLLLAVSYAGVLYYNEKFVFFKRDNDDDINGSIFTGKYAFLTNLNLVFLTGCLVYSAVCSCLIPKRSSMLHSLDGLLGGASSTMSLFVFALFWTLYTVDRELVYPSELDSIIPVWHNHALHTTIVPASLANFCLVPRHRAPSFAVVQAASAFLGLAYIAWIHVIHAVTGVWVYPLLEILTGAQRLCFIAVCCLTLMPFAWAVHSVRARVDAARLRAAAKAASSDGKSS